MSPATSRSLRPILVCALLLILAGSASAADVFVRFKIDGPADEKYFVTTGGWRHDGKKGQWNLTPESLPAAAGQWSPWIDADRWDLHGRLNRAGGVAEWPAMKISVLRADNRKPVTPVAIDVQLADKPQDDAVVATFREISASNTIGFLLPHPLRQHKDQIESGSQMVARQLRWAKEAAGPKPAKLNRFDFITGLWGPYDPALARQSAEALSLLGFNVLGGTPVEVLRDLGMRTYTATWHLQPDPDLSNATWEKSGRKAFDREAATGDARWKLDNLAHVVVSDEIQTLNFRRTDPVKLNGWFRDFLRERGMTDESLGRPIDKVEYPAEMMYRKVLPRDVDLAERKIAYFAAKFGHFWSVKQLRHTHDLIKGTLPGARTETLPADHAFFNAWGAPHVGMSARCLDLFEIGHQEAVDIISVEDWLGLNRMYGPGYTWTGGQSHGYLAAIFRSGIGDHPVALRSLITVSDDGYLRLKAYSALGQGIKSIFFWTFGPTYIGTENYWSDLRSQYDGVAKTSRALARTEDVLHPAKTVSDPVAVLYSVSHDIWYPDDPAAFVETRLTWHALRHLSIQPDFVREEDVEAGRLKNYKVLYLAGRCLSRKASEAVDQWVRAGGVLYLSAAAATRDEFTDPCLPPFSAAVWPDNAAKSAVHAAGYQYNERRDLPGAQSLATASVTLGKSPAFDVRSVGCRLDLKKGLAPVDSFAAKFDDGKPAAAVVEHGKGKVFAVGFMPGLAYSPFKTGQVTLDEVWRDDLRQVFAAPLRAAGVTGVVEASVPVVEANLLRGPAGSAIVLVNYTYKPISQLKLVVPEADVRGQPFTGEGVAVKVSPGPRPGTRTLELPLEWTDIVALPVK